MILASVAAAERIGTIRIPSSSWCSSKPSNVSRSAAVQLPDVALGVDDPSAERVPDAPEDVAVFLLRLGVQGVERGVESLRSLRSLGAPRADESAVSAASSSPSSSARSYRAWEAEGRPGRRFVTLTRARGSSREKQEGTAEPL